MLIFLFIIFTLHSGLSSTFANADWQLLLISDIKQNNFELKTTSFELALLLNDLGRVTFIVLKIMIQITIGHQAIFVQ